MKHIEFLKKCQKNHWTLLRQGIGGRDCMEGMEGQVTAPSHWIGIGGGGSRRENDL
jgi:hypothetical protein